MRLTVSSLALCAAVVGPIVREAGAFSPPPALRRASGTLARPGSVTRLASSTAAPAASAPPSSANLGVKKGDTKGANLLLTDLHISTGGGNQILRSINFRVDPNERWGIVGPNGCGKSTVREREQLFPDYSILALLCAPDRL